MRRFGGLCDGDSEEQMKAEKVVHIGVAPEELIMGSAASFLTSVHCVS